MAGGDRPPATDPPPVRSAVLCVDLDGTLVRTDTLYEYALIAVKARPDVILRLPFWLSEAAVSASSGR